MSIESAVRDYAGSYTLGEADGEHWASSAHFNEIQSIAVLTPEDIGQRDIIGNISAGWLSDQAESYRQMDPRFEPEAYLDGFLTSVRRAKRRFAFAAVAGSRSRMA
jgi:hypothetical protein